MNHRSRIERLEQRRPPMREDRESIMARINARLDGMRQRLNPPELDAGQVEDILAEARTFRVGLRQRLNRR
jgi:hypothetical protein